MAAASPRWWERLGDALVYSHAWIGLCAAAQALSTYWFIARREEVDAMLALYALLLFGATVSFYGFHRLYGLRKQLPHVREPRWWAVYRLRRVIAALVLAGLVATLYLAAQLPREWLWRLAVPGAVSALYAVPLLRGVRLRDSGRLKALWLSVGWVWLCVYVPLDATGATPAYALLGERLCFLLALTLPFDYRDVAHDRAEGVRTWPQRLGRAACRWASLGFLALGAACATQIPLPDYAELIGTAGIAVTYVLAVPLVLYAYRERTPHHLYFGLVLDGLLLVPLVAPVGILQLWTWVYS